MPFPESVADLRDLVSCMREVGAVQAFGVVLGPAPVPAKELTETPEEKRSARIEAARQDVRDKIGRPLTDAEADRFIDPSVFEA